MIVVAPETTVPATGVLLDLDGTIMDSQEGILHTFRHTLEQVGCDVPADPDLSRWIGPSFPSSLRKWTDLDEQGIRRAIEIYGAHYLMVGEAMSRPFEGMVEMINELHACGITLGLATSKPRSQALQMLERVGIRDLFVATGCASDDEKRGTKSEVIADALNELAEKNINPSQFLMVGDRIHDIEAAREHNLISVAVTWGYGNREEWAHAHHTVSSPSELRALIFDMSLQETY